jgi:hypothetical protein
MCGNAVMRNQTTRWAVRIASGLAMLLTMGGCPGAFEATLPDDLDADMKYILNNRQEFRQESAGGVDTGVVIDDLQGLSACWGAFVEAVGGQGLGGQMDSFSLWRFGPEGTLTTWDVVDMGGLFAAVYDGTGRWDVVGDNRLRFTIDHRRYFNPLTRRYEVFDDKGEVTEWLATLDGDRLYVLMLHAPGATPPGPNDPDYTMIYRRFDCAK